MSTKTSSSARPHGATLRAIRLIKGLTQDQVAAQVGVAANYLSRIETGRRHAKARLTPEFARVLDVPPAILTGHMPVIRLIREHLGVPAAVVAANAGLTEDRLRRIEDGAERATPDELLLIAHRLDVDPDVLRAYVHQHEPAAGAE